MITFSKLLTAEQKDYVIKNSKLLECISDFGEVYIGIDGKGIYCSSVKCNRVKKYI